jgi:hypothetical protein
MPAPNAKQLAELTKVNFRAFQIKIPVEWSQPGDQYPDAFKPGEKTVPPPPPTAIFFPASANKYHVDAAKDTSDKFTAYIDGISSAMCSAIDNWMKMVTLTGAIINGPVAMVIPGGFVSAPLLPLILASAPMKTPMESKYSMAIANAFSTAWQTWQLGLTGTLMYPAFAAFPGPMAPPTPNVPMPLVTLSSPGEAMLSPTTLKTAMVGMLGDPTAAHADKLFDALCKAFGTVFPIFKASTMVNNVMGMGPIPTFAPPFVPVGPVLGGTVIPTPGILT